MANLIYSGGSGSAFSASSCQKLYVKYKPASALMKVGESLDLATVMPITEKIDITFQSQSGTQQVCTNFPLLVLAHIEGLEAANIVYVQATPQVAENDSVPKAIIEYIEFTIPIFKVCRLFQAGDQLSFVFSLSGGTVEVSSVENPFQSNTEMAIEYQQMSINPNSSNTIEGIKKIYLPNNDKFVFNVTGNKSVVWKQADFWALFSDEFVSNYTPLKMANFLGLGLIELSSIKLTATTEALIYYFIK